MIPILLLTLLLGHPPDSQRRQASAEEKLTIRLQQNVDEYTLKADNFLQALAKVAAQFQIPMGIEWILSPDTLRNVYFSWRHTTPREILQGLVETQPGFELEIKNGIVRVFPRNSLMDKNNFLNIPIDKFSVHSEYVMFANHRLWARLHAAVAPPLRPSGGEAGSIASGMGDRRASFELENVTVRDVIDKLALAADFKVWVVTYPEKPALSRTGFRRAVSVFNEDYPAVAQPVWDLLPWGFDPVAKQLRPDWKTPIDEAAAAKPRR